MACVEVKNGYKYYGSSSIPKIALNYLNMNVETGSIYGLLGASGCGKTTLLSCIVGQKQLNSGDIRVLGLKPGLLGSGIPGPIVGYMPQDVALIMEMTVKEIFYYFGRIYDMDDEKINERYNLLKYLLELPPSNRLVDYCSGGEKRRISFSCALIHEPKILILDEPTVGLDPILRAKIWDFLEQTTLNNKMSVIITTHYIEEATKANRIGLMRNGVLVAEDTPVNIMNNLECRSLEEAFLKLSKRQGSDDVFKNITQSQILTHVDITDQQSILVQKIKNKKHKRSFTSKNRMMALFTKSAIQFRRQPSSVINAFFLPVMCLAMYMLTVGLVPKSLRLGIVNDEVKNIDKCLDNSLPSVVNYNNESCEFNYISCLFINELNPDFIEKVFYASTEEAYKSAAHTDILGYIHIPFNFSKSMQSAIDNGRYIDDNAIDNMQIDVRMDMTNQQLSYFVQRSLLEKYQSFIVGIMSSCNIAPGLGKTPVNIKTLYGSFDDEYQKYITPGAALTIIFLLSTIMTSSVFIADKSDGIWDRTLVAGISTSEMLLVHITFQSILMIVQCVEIAIISHYVFGVENNGGNFSIILLLILISLCGVISGLLVSILCSKYLAAVFVITGAFYPIMILSGVFWPIEGMHILIRKIAVLVPTTIPTQSAHNILGKGWTIDNFDVYKGFLVLIGWIIVCGIFCVIGLKRKT